MRERGFAASLVFHPADQYAVAATTRVGTPTDAFMPGRLPASGGDPEIDPAFGLNERTLETARVVVWKRERSERGNAA